MRNLTYDEIRTMNGNGSSMRALLRYFIEKGAEVFLVHEEKHLKIIERYFLVTYKGMKIPLRAYNLNLYPALNSLLSYKIADDKGKSQAMLDAYGLPVPKTIPADSVDDFGSIINTYKKLVVKPRFGAHGEGITVGVDTVDGLKRAIHDATAIYPDCLIQQYVSGNDHRLLFIDYRFVAAVKRIPAAVIGTGKHSIRQLVEENNREKSKLWQAIRDGSAGADETRGSISKIPLAEIIAARGEAFLDHTPQMGEYVQVVDKANVSIGGQTEDVTDIVNSTLTDEISEMLKSIGMPICGVDVMSSDISSNPSEKKSYIIELNTAPGLRLHEMPMKGTPRPVCSMVAESLIRKYTATK